MLLDLTDGLLGILVLIFIFVLLKEMRKEILEHREANTRGSDKPAHADLIVSDTGITMADGGKPIGEGSATGEDVRLYISKNGILKQGGSKKPDDDTRSQPEKS
jgi:hypothetical protein